MDKTSIQQILKNLPKDTANRITLYLNTERIEDQYFQNGGLSSIEISEESAAEIGGGFQIVIAKAESKLSNRQGGSGRIEISPVLMAMILEGDKQNHNLLYDPATTMVIPSGALLKHVADTRFVTPAEIVSSQTTNLPEDMARIVELEREQQLQGYADLGATKITVVWTSTDNMYLASIANADFLNKNNFSSYRKGLIGILGVWEKDISNVRFISPLWLWHEGFNQ